MIRPKRYVIETCNRCDRPGWQHERRYVLLTEDEYRKRGWADGIQGIVGMPDSYEMMWVGCGGSINEAIEEAKQYCADYGIPGVGFKFNDLPVLVSALSDTERIYRDWWKRAYNETPEESFARR